MRTHRIAFTKENRDASREGRKTQTRRVIVPQPNPQGSYVTNTPGEPGTAFIHWCDMEDIQRLMHPNPGRYWHTAEAPYAPGDRLAMLEPVIIDWAEHTTKRLVKGVYVDDMAPFAVELTPAEWDKWLDRKKPYAPTPARFMYTSLARTFFEVVSVRAERLQNISEDDAKAEGVLSWPGQFEGQIYYQDYSPEDWNVPCYTARDSFRTLWDSINTHRYPWSANPWVWVYEYRLAEQAVDNG